MTYNVTCFVCRFFCAKGVGATSSGGFLVLISLLLNLCKCFFVADCRGSMRLREEEWKVTLQSVTRQEY